MKFLGCLLLLFAFFANDATSLKAQFFPENYNGAGTFGLQTKEVYSVLKDKKGCVWIGHRLGLSKFNGTFYTSYHIPQQLSESMCNLVEDKLGRIWCSNFVGQIFYVDHETLHLYKEVDFSRESLPTLDVVDSCLYITSVTKGLFVLNTITNCLAWEHHAIDGSIVRGIQSFVKLKNPKQLLILGIDNWYLYDVSKPHHFVPLPLPTTTGKLAPSQISKLFKTTNSDTFLAFHKPSSTVVKVLYKNNALICLGSVAVNNFIMQDPWWQKWWIFLFFVILFILVVYLIVQQRINTINKNNELVIEKIQLESELRSSMLTAMKSQMNPHFIFNALNTIQSYIYTNDKQKASSYLGKFSNLIRIILASSSKKMITLTEELETLQLYIDLEEMRFEDNFSAEIIVDEWLNTDAIALPPMLVQPYIENAIKHGLLHKEEQRVLKVTFKNLVVQQALQITIEDNGIGRERSAVLNNKKNSGLGFATAATEKRIDILNHSLHHKIKINVMDKKNSNGQSSGTIVNLTLPNELLRND